jgi:hypothetical protein
MPAAVAAARAIPMAAKPQGLVGRVAAARGPLLRLPAMALMDWAAAAAGAVPMA